MDTKGDTGQVLPPPYTVDPMQQPQPEPCVQPQPYVQSQPQAYGGYGYGYSPQPAANQSTTANTVVMVAPQAQMMSGQRQVQDNMVISIISIFFCCLLGIVATIKASDSRDALSKGDRALAERHSVSARKLAIAAIVVGCVCAALSIVFSILGPVVVAASASSRTNY